MSKFSLDVLNRCVFPLLKSDDPDVVLGAEFGEDVALTRVGGDILASHVDPIVGAVQGIGWLAVHVACNDIATCGAPPRWILPLVLVPDKEDETLVKNIMTEIARAAKEINVTVIGGHTGYSANLDRPLVAVTALGTLGGRKPILTRGAQVGDLILVTKGIGLEGTGILASDFGNTARSLGLTESDIDRARALMNNVSVIPEALLLAQHGATSMHDVTRGGLLETLLEIAELSGVGLQVDYESVPIPEIVDRFASAFNFDPLKMISSGTLALTISAEHIEEAQQQLDEKQIPYAVIGKAVPGKGVQLIKENQVIHYVDIRPEEDELARMWQEYSPD
ncbi:MAG TPA: AIR synthase family protein [Brevefilum fermentans]|jgi:hydrogenase expression/formation protein HypE|uniref:Hydrogenase expression/formation protein HypE n=1 Tax=Candidatus Brevifilum fermentans TaxID=1986204 RepID=A0A1Y6K751_9CHLR|nr:AIR synthase family protein [Brevefilum fermentans]MDI9566124.1 AIR synthase family protein [Chloroflexota bacterium]OQB84296.1 MAG: Hydrogenase expression/formation protein HypE [Chloroflexi bacterium ADurb.Bin120]SMX54708.1 Hydrogenase expression/formation protein HypE [Brevefilum fermentans]HPX96266.1 AIR synthase family protein [Brevefilum fermentans]HQA29307.1 AIR synthase family protein [Brevefilum fermentans]